MGNTMQDEVFMKKAIELSKLAVEHGNEPFGAVLVKDGKAVFCETDKIPAINLFRHKLFIFS